MRYPISKFQISKIWNLIVAKLKPRIVPLNCLQNLAGNAAPAADGVQTSANGAGNSEKIPEEKEEASK